MWVWESKVEIVTLYDPMSTLKEYQSDLLKSFCNQQPKKSLIEFSQFAQNILMVQEGTIKMFIQILDATDSGLDMINSFNL